MADTTLGYGTTGMCAMNGGGNFDTHPDWKHDIFLQVQSLVPGVGDIKSGKADSFVKRAYTQNWWHTEDRLAEEQDKFRENDPFNNTPGRGYRNYRRMEYDIVTNPNGKGAENDRNEANERKVLNKDEVISMMKNHMYALCTTASATSNTPITQNDYKDQIKLR
ncbi:MAG: hypothetical protein MJZ25_04085 [Fibrobacter sp.]|nr:hypothetical protein [Fibrobacter sp.]